MTVSFGGPGIDTFEESLGYFASMPGNAAFDHTTATFFATCKHATDATHKPAFTYTFAPLTLPTFGSDSRSTLATISLDNTPTNFTYAEVIVQMPHLRAAFVLSQTGAPNIPLLTRLVRAALSRATTLN
jgi:hypothetical protein